MSQCFNCQSDVRQCDSAPVCDSHSSFCRLNMNSKDSDQPTSSSEKHDHLNIEHKSLFQLPQNLRPRDAEGLGKRRPDASRLRTRPACDRVTSQKTAYYHPTTARANMGVSDCTTNCTLQHASKRYIILIYVCLGRVFL